MIEKITLHLAEGSKFVPEEGTRCEDMTPKSLLLYAGAKCAGQTAMHIMEKERIYPRRFEISMSGDVSTDPENMFRSFHAVYNIECDSDDDQVKVSRAVTLAHEKYCGMARILRKIAPLSHEIAIVSTQPEKV